MDLLPMMIAELVSKVLLVSVFAYLFAMQRERFLGIWTLGWLSSALLTVSLILALDGPALWSTVGNAFMLASAGAFLWGGKDLARQPVGVGWRVLLGLGCAWVVGAPFLDLSFAAVNVPLALLLGTTLISAAWSLIRRSGVRGFEAYLAGGALFLWGVHVYDYPFLGNVEWSAPYGFLVSFALQLAAALGMLLLYLRRYHESLRRNEARMAEAQRMEALGRLAGGVAHDFNNLLTVILGSVSLLDHTEENRDRLADVKKAALRASELAHQLLAFSRGQVARAQRVDFPEAVASVSRLLERIIGEDVQLEISGSDPAWIETDPGNLEQILLNLAVNARDAMPEGGRLRFATRPVDLGVALTWPGGELAPGPYAELTVADEGVGISKDALEHVFEPFYTTKADSQGTGLGLSIVRALVDKARGVVLVESEPGAGTTFRLLFPRVPAPESAEEPEPRSADTGGTETILVAEDDEKVRVLVARILRAVGYQVLEAEDGMDALEAVAAFDGDRHIDLLLTDVVMPKHSAPDLAERFLEQHREGAVLFMSGYTAGRLKRIPLGCRFLAKPFTSQELTAAVREALDAAGSKRGSGTD